MYTVMVTGGLGSGKSTLCKLICEHGAMSMNLDEIYRGLLESNENMIADLADRFGDDILDDSGMVIRSKLAEEAFSDEQSTKDLNAITFPYIMAMTNDYLLDVHCVPALELQSLGRGGAASHRGARIRAARGRDRSLSTSRATCGYSAPSRAG